MRRVSARPPHLHAGHDRRIVVHQLEDAGLGERQVIVRQVARPIALVRMVGIVPLSAADDVLGAGKTRSQRAVGVTFVDVGGAVGILEID